MKKELFIVVVFLTVLMVSCVPPEPYDGDCLIASVTKIDENETTGLASYEIELAPTFKYENVSMLVLLDGPDGERVIYTSRFNVFTIEDWPKGEPIKCALYTGEIDDPFWLDFYCSEYYYANYLMITLE